MTKTQTTNVNPSIPRALAWCAFLVWALSLALPGFSAAMGTVTFYGIEILAFGILFGWAVGGWSAYANILFLAIAYMLLERRVNVAVGWPTIMIVLAMTLPLFDGPILSSATMTPSAVTSWGWGAIVWLMSLLLLAAATCWRPSWTPLRVLVGIGVSVFAVLCGTAIVRLSQASQANEQEREYFLPRTMALTSAPLCGLPFSWPRGPVVSPDDVITLEIDPRLVPRITEGAIRIPKLRRYVQNGFKWEVHPSPSPFIPKMQVGTPATSTNVVLEVRESSDGAVIRLSNRVSNIVLYEQSLRFRQTLNGAETCPLPGQDNGNGPIRGYYLALQRALGSGTFAQNSSNHQTRTEHKPETARLTAEVATRCSATTELLGGKGGEQTIDGRRVIFPADARSFLGLCSENYVGLVFLRARSNEDQSDMNADVYVFDRKTLRPLAEFKDRSGCAATRCDGRVSASSIEYLRISNDAVFVQTIGGLVAARRKA